MALLQHLTEDNMNFVRIASIAAIVALADASAAFAAADHSATAFQVAQMARPGPGPAAAGSEHESHHPGQEPSSAQPMGPGGQGMMGGGGMMHMMHMMEMMGQGGPGMMGGPGPMGPGMMGGMRARMMTEHVEGRIAFLRAELKITSAQAPAWDRFADSLRTNAKKLSEHASARAAPSQPTLAERIEHEEHRLAARLEGVRAIKAALGPLYAALSDDQKKLAERLVPHHVGLMPMGMM
jgi:hypothetical protein